MEETAELIEENKQKDEEIKAFEKSMVEDNDNVFYLY